ncbi:unnamed protein product [Schistocephalus solidus]|uniref:Guanylate kinase-like domain-containing protein n=1 Tax=Schistocephalus solidus TaxID=70667 RepID=A0A183TKJ2_SCHSO|nr:unnamed protein product [Schistocephalus solidus]
MERFPLPRPIVLYGPLANRARQLLVEASVSEGTEDGSLGERLQFELPPISGKPFEAGGWTEMSAGVIRMSAIQAVMERGNHPLVDLRPSSVEGLIQNGLPPIVLLFTASSIEQIKLILDRQQQQQQSSEDSTVNGRRWKYTKEKSRQLWAEAISLRQTIPHLITDCVPLINSFQEGELDETEWLNNLLSVIRYQQSQPLAGGSQHRAHFKLPTMKAFPWQGNAKMDSDWHDKSKQSICICRTRPGARNHT